MQASQGSVEMKCLALDYVSEEHLLPAGIVSELHPNLTLYFNICDPRLSLNRYQLRKITFSIIGPNHARNIGLRLVDSC
jgi:hypothetical protein